eukprot:7174575-Alexandrium_andersonii.AAC.1
MECGGGATTARLLCARVRQVECCLALSPAGWLSLPHYAHVVPALVLFSHTPPLVRTCHHMPYSRWQQLA